jgi:hypothetical protein
MSTASITAGIRQAVTGTAATGSVEFQLAQPAVVGPLTFGTNNSVPEPVTAGEFASPVILQTDAWWRITVQTDAWRAQFTVFIPSTTTVATVGQLFDMAAPPPVTPVLYIPRSLMGVPGGVATIDPITGFITAGLLPPEAASMHPWDVAKTFAGLADATIITELFNDSENPFEAEANTTYSNVRIICSSVIVSSTNHAHFVNCDIQCHNSNFGIRVDADTGFEVGRRFKQCKITAAGVAFAGAGYTATLCEIVGNGDDFARVGRSYAEKTVLELCYAHDFRPAVGAHVDGIQQLSPPGAGTYVSMCWIEMRTDPNYTIDPTSGYTGGGFYDPADVPIGVDDPFPHWIGPLEFDQCRIVSEDNYSIVSDANGMDVSNCMLLPGTTDIASIADGVIVTGHNNIDANGVPLTSVDIAGFPLTPYTLANAQDVLLSNPTDSQVVAYDLASKTWKNKTVSSGGGGSSAARYYSTGWVTTAFGPGGSGQNLTPNTQMPGPLQLAIPGTEVSAGDIIVWRMGLISTGGDAQCDVASIVGGEPVNFYSGEFTPNQNDIGAGDLYQTGDFGFAQPTQIEWVVQETDLDPDNEGSFRLSFLYVSGGNRMWGLGSQIGKVTMLNLGH